VAAPVLERAVKKVAILQSNYIPWKGYFNIIDNVDTFIILDDIQFTKNDWRNRNRIKTTTGTRWLTIPVQHERLSQKICEVRVADRQWAEKHWACWAQNYSKTAHFAQHSTHIENIYSTAASLEFLSEINFLFLTAISSILGIQTRFIKSTDFITSNDRIGRLIDICAQTGATHYISGPAAQGYLDIELFAAKGITVEWMDYTWYPKYSQTTEPFDHAVSILDLIFNVGSEARLYFTKHP
jgi:hypothetical protein